MRQTLTDKLDAFFRACPLVWIDGEKLGTIAGKYAWRSRVSDLRRQRSMTIENRQDHFVNQATGQRWTRSLYRYVPPAGQLDLLESAKDAWDEAYDRAAARYDGEGKDWR